MKTAFVLLMGGILVIFVGAVISLLAAVPMYFLWNGLLPDLFAFKTITFLQAWGLTFLSSLLFKSNSATTKTNE